MPQRPYDERLLRQALEVARKAREQKESGGKDTDACDVDDFCDVDDV